MEVNYSFTKIIKDEIIKNDFDEATEIAILSAFIRLKGTFSIFNNEEAILVKSENNPVIKYIYSLIKKIFPEAKTSVAVLKGMKLYKSYIYVIRILSNIDEVLKTLQIDFLSFDVPTSFTQKDEKLKGYFIGSFLASGSCSNPKSSNYHFEIALHQEELAMSLLKASSKIKAYHFDFKVAKRRAMFVLYLKKSEQIASFLAYLEAFNSSLEYEDYRLDRDFKNITNRQANLDYYNYNKSIKNSKDLVDIINTIDRKVGINNISNVKLRYLCEIKKANPEASYQELANLLSEKLGKKVSKSNVNHLIISLREMKDRYDS